MADLKSFDYKANYKGIIPDGDFRISPSMVSKFNDKKWEWYASQVIGEDTFKDNKSTILGTCIHKVAEEWIKNGNFPLGLTEYIDSFNELELSEKEFIKSQLEPMGNALIDYLSFFGTPEISEETIKYEIMPHIWVAGTVDAKIDDCIVDFKTTSIQTVQEKMPNNYKWQLLTYAWIYKKLGIEINKIRIVWVTQNRVGEISQKTGKPLKDYYSMAYPITEEITEEDMRFIDDYLHLIAETYQMAKDKPELTYLLFADYRLKEKDGNK